MITNRLLQGENVFHAETSTASFSCKRLFPKASQLADFWVKEGNSAKQNRASKFFCRGLGLAKISSVNNSEITNFSYSDKILFNEAETSSKHVGMNIHAEEMCRLYRLCCALFWPTIHCC